MAYSTYQDVLDICGLTLTRVSAVYEGDKTDAQVQSMIEDFIDEADQQIKDLLLIPIIIHDETHIIDEDVSVTKVYLGSYDDAGVFLETWQGTQPINVQGLVDTVLCVCLNGTRIKTTDDNYPWAWTHSVTPTEKDYITFTNDLGDGDVILIRYSYDPYAVTVPLNVKKASQCLAGRALIEALIGLRQSITAFEAEGDSAERIPDKEALFNTRTMLNKMAEDALNSVGYGFSFEPIKG